MNLTHNRTLLNNRFPRVIIVLFLFFSLLLIRAPLSHGEEPFFSIALKKFNNEQDARKEESRLKNSGHNAFYRKEKDPVSGSYIYQVYIEKYASRDEAQAEARVLKDLELISDYKINEIKDTPQTAKTEEALPFEKEPKTGTESQPTGLEEQAPEPKSKEAGQTPEPEAKTVDTTAGHEQPQDTKKPDQVSGEIEKKVTEPETREVEQERGQKLKEPGQALAPEAKTVETTAGHEQPQDTNKLDQASGEIEKKAKESEIKEPVTGSEQTPGISPVPEKQVENPAPETNSEHDSLIGASLQVGAFKDEANAEELKIQLVNLGKKAFYRKEVIDHEETYYRLYITGYKSLRDAIKDAKMLLKSGVISGYARINRQNTTLGTRSSKQVDEENRGKIYTLHVSSDKEEANAKEAVARFKKLGYKAAYAHEMINSEGWYRVYIGEFKDEAEAREKGAELRKKGLISYFKPVAIDPEKLNY